MAGLETTCADLYHDVYGTDPYFAKVRFVYTKLKVNDKF